MADDIQIAPQPDVVQEAPKKKKSYDKTPRSDQGEAAKALGLSKDACPYASGVNRDEWLAGYGD